jgi:transposase
MGSRRTFSLVPTQRDELVEVRDNHDKPHMRERAAALIKISDGQSAYEVARSGLLRPRDVDSVYAWMDRYEGEGLDGLRIRAGRGRKPAFSPSSPNQRGGTG